MKPILLFEDHSAKLYKDIPNEKELIQDLNLHVIFSAMAKNDTFLRDTVKHVILNSLTETDMILYRQDIMKDCINERSAIFEFYSIASKAILEADYFKEFNQPSYTRIVPPSERVQKSLGLLELLIKQLDELRNLCVLSTGRFHSKGLTNFCSRQTALLSEEFFVKVKEHIADLKSLSLEGRLVIGSTIGYGMKGKNHVLRKIVTSHPVNNSKKKLLKTSEPKIIPLENISMANSAREIEDAGLIHILRIINHFTKNILEFFEALRYEIGFYAGCINLYNMLSELNTPVCFPCPEEKKKRTLIFQCLYDASMALTERKKLVTNDLNAVNTNLFIITGANQGGKSTFLRSIGLSQIFMQCGMFVPAVCFRANVCDNVFTHFTRKEDIGMNSGKLEEELIRMNNIINNLARDSILFLNESFATTTERDGSRIAMDITTALHELNVKIIFVTHLFEFANSMYNLNLEKAVFLRAERNEDGSRSYRIEAGKPLQTSYGEDLFQSVMGR